jgi:hypothetical protein
LRDRPEVAWTALDSLDYARSAALFSRQTCDIVIAPLRDNPFNRAKSHLKFLEYTVLGVPGVYSRLPPYAGIVRHGENGLLAGDETEWERCLVELIESPARRQALAAAAQQTVRDQWLMAHGARLWRTLYESVLAPGYQRPALAVHQQMLVQSAQVIHARHRALDAHISGLTKQVADLRRELDGRQQALVERQKELVERQKELDERQHELSERNQELAAIVASPAWRQAQTLERWRARLAPEGSRRRRWLDALARLSRPTPDQATRQ